VRKAELSCGEGVFVNHAAESVSAIDPETGVRGAAWWWGLGVGCAGFECSVGPMGVVVLQVAGGRRLEMATPKDQDPIETFSPDGADPTFCVGVRLRVLALGCG
jgi:hypothetical protein